jgi:hypothetical protein
MKRRSFLRGLLAAVAAPVAVAKAAVSLVQDPWRKAPQFIYAPYLPVYTTPPLCDMLDVKCQTEGSWSNEFVVKLTEASEQIYKSTKRSKNNWIQIGSIRYTA